MTRANIETRCAMNLTDYHAKYFAYELTKRSPSDSVETFAGVLADAQVDLNPNQIEAALFAFRNPFSRGAILADEVGLGKTIEAGLLLSQRWAVRLFVKLPDWFKIETPVGTYNPDWAIVKHQDKTIYLVRETKSTKDFLKLRTTEADNVRCGQRHFEALDVPFAVATTAEEI